MGVGYWEKVRTFGRNARLMLAGAVSMVVGLGSASMSLVGGTMIATLGYRAFFLANTAAVVAGAVFFWGYFGKSRHRSTVGRSAVREGRPRIRR